jgi:hypothetical protein
MKRESPVKPTAFASLPSPFLLLSGPPGRKHVSPKPPSFIRWRLKSHLERALMQFTQFKLQNSLGRTWFHVGDQELFLTSHTGWGW